MGLISPAVAFSIWSVLWPATGHNLGGNFIEFDKTLKKLSKNFKKNFKKYFDQNFDKLLQNFGGYLYLIQQAEEAKTTRMRRVVQAMTRTNRWSVDIRICLKTSGFVGWHQDLSVDFRICLYKSHQELRWRGLSNWTVGQHWSYQERVCPVYHLYNWFV